MIDPHGGVLVDRFVPRDASLAGLPRVQLNPRQLSDAYLIAQGAFSPLRGFMGSRDYQGVLQDMHLAGGHPWSMPITLAVTEEEARSLKAGSATTERVRRHCVGRIWSWPRGASSRSIAVRRNPTVRESPA